MKNIFVNSKTSISKINSIIKRIEDNSIPTVYRKDVIQSKKQEKKDKIAAINRHIANVGYNEKFIKIK